MEAASLEFLKKQTEAANPSRRIVTTDREPRHVYYVEQPDGELDRVIALDNPLRHETADLDTLVRVAKAALADFNPHIWYGRDGVVAVIEPDSSHTDICRLSLSPSPQFAKLAEWDRAGKGSPSQAELVILLRTLFAGCAPNDFLPTVRGVKTSRKADVDSQIAQGKVSLGKSIVAEMTGVNAIPDRVTFVVPVFAQAAVPVTEAIRVEIDPDPQNERFNLIVIPGDIEAAFAAAEEVIASRLERLIGEDAIPVYRGKP